MNTDIEFSLPLEIRASGNVLTGQALVYGEQARDRPEMFLPGSFKTGLDTASLNLQHDRSRIIAEQPGELTFTDTVHSLSLRAKLRPDSAEARLVERKALRGLSVEFVALDETQDKGLRVITKAHLAGCSLVDSGSYRTDVEIRQKMDRAWLRASIPYGERMECACQDGGCDSVMFEPGSLQVPDETLVIAGQGFSSVLGQVKRGTAIIQDSKKKMMVGLTSPTTRAAREVIESAAVSEIFLRPIIDPEESEFVDEGPTRVFTSAAVRGFLVKATNRSKGIPPVEIDGVVEPRRRRLWL